MNETEPTTDDRSTVEPPPPASDVDRRIASLTDAVQRVAQSQQEMLESLRSQSQAGGAATSAAPAGLTAASPSSDIRRIVRDVLREREAQHARSDARDRYVRAKMADLPDAYRRLMPETDDANALAGAERDVRKRFREDVKSMLAAPDDVGAPGAGERPAAALDYSKLSPLQQIALGLKGTRRADGTRPGQTTFREPAQTSNDADANPGIASGPLFGPD